MGEHHHVAGDRVHERGGHQRPDGVHHHDDRGDDVRDGDVRHAGRREQDVRAGRVPDHRPGARPHRRAHAPRAADRYGHHDRSSHRGCPDRGHHRDLLAGDRVEGQVGGRRRQQHLRRRRHPGRRPDSAARGRLTGDRVRLGPDGRRAEHGQVYVRGGRHRGRGHRHDGAVVHAAHAGPEQQPRGRGRRLVHRRVRTGQTRPGSCPGRTPATA